MVSDAVGADLIYAATFNGEQDVWYLRLGSRDCDRNGTPDESDLAVGRLEDCNGNSLPDACEIAAGTATDSNSDGVIDACDNCINKANGPLNSDAGGNIQLDTDNDRYGNICDPDLDGDNVAGILDFNIFRSAWLKTTGDPAFNPDCDFDGDGVVGILDFNIFRNYWLKAPGPSGLVP